MSTGRLEGKVAWVTGASRGIRREVALTLAREGAAVGVGHFPDPEQTARAHGVVEQCREMGARAIALPGDVCDGSASREAVRALIAALGRLDVVVTNAGIVHRQPLVEMSEAAWDRVVAVNLKGTFNTVQAAIPHLVQQGRGKIVTVASELALVGRAGLSAYTASKAGVIGLTKCLARELAPLGINVNAVAPGPTEGRRHMSSPSTPSWPPERSPRPQTGGPAHARAAGHRAALADSLRPHGVHIARGLPRAA